MNFPKHDASLHLTHNDHKASYQSTAEWVEENDARNEGWKTAWVSDEQREKAIATDSVWVLQWYPDTPVGFYVLAGADLDVLLAAACDTERFS